MNRIFILFVLPAFAFAAGTHGSETTETDTMHFYYDPDTHYFVAATKSTCFMAALTRDEQDHVHTVAGIEDLELLLMREWLGKLAETKIYHDDTSLPSNIRHWCGNKDIYLLERNIPSVVQSSTKSPVMTTQLPVTTS